MSNNVNNEKIRKETLTKIESINAVEGFDPMSLAREFGNMNDGTMRKRLPVNAQMAWFRLKHPEGRIAVDVKPEKDYFVAKARVYVHYDNPDSNYLAEGSASRKYSPENPTVSPREWAQTAAVGIALRNAGFGLQADFAGESNEGNILDELAEYPFTVSSSAETNTPAETSGQISLSDEAQLENQSGEIIQPQAQPELSPLETAKAAKCPISKHKDKTLGDLVRVDPKALVYIAESGSKYGEKIAGYAKLICEDAANQAAG